MLVSMLGPVKADQINKTVSGQNSIPTIGEQNLSQANLLPMKESIKIQSKR